MKKMMAVLLCLCMAVSLAAPAFATEGTDAALLADVLAAVEIAEEADVLLTEEDTFVPMDTPVDEGDGDDPVKDDGTGLGDETVKDREDSTDEGGDEGDGEEEPAFTVPASGSLTETITWAVDENYVLTITGTGAMPDYGSISGAPWYGCFDKLTAIVVDEGVTAIGANNFAWCSASSVALPDGLEAIGEKAFQGMENLETLAFPATLKSIGDFAFMFNSLKTIDLPDGIETLGYSAFDPSSAVTELTLPGSLTSIGENAFAVCDILKTITVEEGITNIPYGCFINCYAVETINLPSTLELLGSSFVGTQGDLDSLKTINVADKTVNGETVTFSVWEDSDGAFFTSEEIAAGAKYSGNLFPIWGEYGSAVVPGDTGSGTIEESWLTWTLSDEGVLTIEGCGDIPDYNEENLPPWDAIKESITSIVILHTGGADINIGTNAFAGCINLTSFTAQSTYTKTIGAGAFQGCTALKSIVIPAPVRAIGEKAFADCTALKTVTFPRSLTDLAKNAFDGCDALYSIRSNATEFRWKYLNELPETINGVTVIYGPTTSTGHGDCGDNVTWKISSTLTYEDKVMTVSGTGPMQDYGTGLDDGAPWLLNPTGQYLVIEEGVTTIGSYAFCDWETLSRVWLPEGLTAIGQGAFQDCSRITSIELPSTIETLGPDCFKNCIALESITVAEGEDKSVTFLHWVDEAGNTYTNGDIAMGAAYEGNLTAVWQTGGKLTDTIEWHLDTDGYLTISGTGAMPDYATAVEGSIAPWSELRYDFAVKYVVIMDGITAVGDYNFYYCPKMESLALPNTIQSLGKECLNLKVLETIDVAPHTDGSTFWGFKDENGVGITAAELLSGEGYAGNLTLLWYGFADVAATDWFYDYVMYCYDEGIMNGVGDGAFDPYGGATRAQVVTVLYRLAGEPTGAADSSFSDIPAGQWFTEAVNWAAANGIAKGYEDGTFAPYNYVTREEFLVFLDRFSESKKLRLNKWSELYDLSEYGVSDEGDISDWALESETWSYFIGLQTGYDNGDGTYSLNPRSYITRAELATFQSRYASNLVLFVYAESCQYMVGYPPSVAVNAFKTEPDEKLEVEEDLEAWCFYDKGVALLVDYSESSKGKIIDWTYTDML